MNKNFELGLRKTRFSMIFLAKYGHYFFLALQDVKNLN